MLWRTRRPKSRKLGSSLSRLVNRSTSVHRWSIRVSLPSGCYAESTAQLCVTLLCFTPGKIPSYPRLTVEDKTYLEKNFTTCKEDRPLVVQFCGNDPDTLLEACKKVQDQCDAVDINFGCPQGIAKKGHYGSYLLESPDLVLYGGNNLVLW